MLNVSDKAMTVIAQEAETRQTYAAGILRIFIADLLEQSGYSRDIVDQPLPKISNNRRTSTSNALASNFTTDKVVKTLRSLYEKAKKEKEKEGMKKYYSFQRYLREQLCSWLQDQGHDIWQHEMQETTAPA